MNDLIDSYMDDNGTVKDEDFIINGVTAFFMGGTDTVRLFYLATACD